MTLHIMGPVSFRSTAADDHWVSPHSTFLPFHNTDVCVWRMPRGQQILVGKQMCTPCKRYLGTPSKSCQGKLDWLVLCYMEKEVFFMGKKKTAVKPSHIHVGLPHSSSPNLGSNICILYKLFSLCTFSACLWAFPLLVFKHPTAQYSCRPIHGAHIFRLAVEDSICTWGGTESTIKVVKADLRGQPEGCFV